MVIFDAGIIKNTYYFITILHLKLMNTDKTAILKNLITDYLPDLNEVNLAELYAYELKLRNGTSLPNIRDISSETLITNFINSFHLNSAASTVYNYTMILKDYLNYAKGVLDNESLMSYLHSKVWGDNTKRRNYVLLNKV